MPKPLGQNICSRIKMPQWDSNQLGRFGLLEALLACCCSFHQEDEAADKGNQPETVHPSIKWLTSMEMVAPLAPSTCWDSKNRVPKKKKTFLLLPNVSSSFSAQTSARKFTFSPKGSDHNSYHQNTKGQADPARCSFRFRNPSIEINPYVRGNSSRHFSMFKESV